MPNKLKVIHAFLFLIFATSIALNIFLLIKNYAKQIDTDTNSNTDTTTNNTECTGTEIYNANDLETIDIQCGDKITLTVEYKGSTGYEPFEPQYNNVVFTLIGTEDENSSNGMLGGDNTIRTYTFQSISRAQNSGIEVGIHRSWEPETTREVQQSVSVNVL